MASGETGRPEFELTDKILRQVEDLAAQGLTQSQIGSMIGCSQKTIERRKKDNVAFAEAIKNGQAKGIATVTNALFTKACEGDNTAMIFFLKCRGGDGWREKQHIEVTTPTVTVKDLTGK